MSSILEQINNLTEQFSNLFEVEGLGQPASDVPPSTNKIKKDRKTKDGKVEIVSVEDELFPYDGNKREQFRQKIIDKINDMIQGTATLEDLLQLVRSKQVKPVKEGFEGAIEILENLREQIDKKIKAGEINLDKALKLDKKIEDKMSSEKNAQEYSDELDKRAKKERLGDKAVVKSIRRNQKKNALTFEGFEGAIEILEKLISERKYSEEELKDIATRVRPERAKQFSKACDELEKATDGKNPDKFTTVQKYRANKAAKKVERTQDRLNHVDDIINPPVKTPTGIKRANESFEGVIEILEEIINEKYVFPKKAVEDGNRKYLEADKKKNEATRLARKGFEKLNKKIKELKAKGIDTDLDIQPGVTYVGGSKGEYQKALKTAQGLHDKQREADREFTKADNEQRKLRLEGNKGVIKREFEPVSTKKGDSYNFKKVLNKNEALKESIQQLSELFDRRSLEDDILKTLTGKGTKQHLQDLGKKLLGLDKKKVKKDKACESFEEATTLLEEIINEVSMKKWTETAREVIPKRKADFKNKEKAYMKSIGGNEKNPEETWYKLTKGIGYPENKEYYEFKDAVKRKNHAKKVSDLNKGSGSASANKVITKANKVADKRYKEDENSDRTWHAANLGNEDPVKSKVWKR